MNKETATSKVKEIAFGFRRFDTLSLSVDLDAIFDQWASTPEGKELIGKMREAGNGQELYDVLVKTKGYLAVGYYQLHKQIDEAIKNFSGNKTAAPDTNIPLYETSLVLYRLMKSFEKIERNDIQEKRWKEADHIIKKYSNPLDALRDTDSATATQVGMKYSSPYPDEITYTSE